MTSEFAKAEFIRSPTEWRSIALVGELEDERSLRLRCRPHNRMDLPARQRRRQPGLARRDLDSLAHRPRRNRSRFFGDDASRCRGPASGARPGIGAATNRTVVTRDARAVWHRRKILVRRAARLTESR